MIITVTSLQPIALKAPLSPAFWRTSSCKDSESGVHRGSVVISLLTVGSRQRYMCPVFPLDTTQEGLSEVLAPLRKYERIIMRMFFPCFVRTVGFSERTLHSSRLKYACIPCGVHLPVWPRPMAGMRCYNGRTIHTLNIVGETVCTSLFPHTPIFFPLRLTLRQMINSNAAAIPGRKVFSSLRQKTFPECPSLAYVLANWRV
jgi:hypothetical protein